LLTVAEAKKRKADTDTQRRKQQKLMQAEQPKAMECAALMINTTSMHHLVFILENAAVNSKGAAKDSYM